MRAPCLLALVPTLLGAQPSIPRTWATADVASLEVPLANPKFSPVHISEETYYRIPARTIYKTYPIYHPSREPAGYLDSLKTREPEIAFDPSKLKSRAEWIAAGELVFNAPASFGPMFFTAADLRDAGFYRETGMPVARDGTIPFARWIVRRKGEVELGSMGCNTCHTRVLPDGMVVPGAQGNNPNDRQGARLMLLSARAMDPAKVLERVRGFALQFEMPWLRDDPNRRTRTMSLDEIIAAGQAIPPGVNARANTNLLVPPQIPDLIGVQERTYLDHTGLIRHRGIGDLMRYSTLVQDIHSLARYGDERAPQTVPGNRTRYSDEQLYALALYLYSLKPPLNPHRTDTASARGKKIFEREGCVACHTPPLYTNNKLIAAGGFVPPADHLQRFDVLDRRLGADPRYTLQSRKGTGYYKVPSLKGVWYRAPLEHNGSVATLEDWFDPARLRDEYVPTGYKGLNVTARAVRGHEFGLKLAPEEKSALLAFLRTL
ncbi:MAG: hypothetical protein ACRD8O_00615 [Bryobacteraceae bacterium]